MTTRRNRLAGAVAVVVVALPICSSVTAWHPLAAGASETLPVAQLGVAPASDGVDATFRDARSARFDVGMRGVPIAEGQDQSDNYCYGPNRVVDLPFGHNTTVVVGTVQAAHAFVSRAATTVYSEVRVSCACLARTLIELGGDRSEAHRDLSAPAPFTLDASTTFAEVEADEDAAARTVQAAEQRKILHVLKMLDWNVTASARRLGWSRGKLLQRMVRHGIERPEPAPTDPRRRVSDDITTIGEPGQ